MVNNTTNCQRKTGSLAAKGKTTAATTAQVAVSGPTINCLEEPNSAYTISGKIVEYKPAIAPTPVSSAYAIETGNDTAATDNPALISKPRYSRL